MIKHVLDAVIRFHLYTATNTIRALFSFIYYYLYVLPSSLSFLSKAVKWKQIKKKQR